MSTDLNGFTFVANGQAGGTEHERNAADSGCRSECRVDIRSVEHRYQFVTLAFEQPQTVFRLPQWRWPVIGPYNGFSGPARIRGWQLLRFYQMNGWLTYDDVCSVTGAASDTQLHNEDYGRPWDAFPVSKRAHRLIHTRQRFQRTWREFLAKEALPDTWANSLSCDVDLAAADEGCSVAQLLALAPHPAWIVVPVNEFESR